MRCLFCLSLPLVRSRWGTDCCRIGYHSPAEQQYDVRDQLKQLPSVTYPGGYPYRGRDWAQITYSAEYHITALEFLRARIQVRV